jgi:hypothetical protein
LASPAFTALFYKGLHSALCASVKKLVSPTAKIQANDLWQTTVKGWGILQNTGRIRGAETEVQRRAEG